MRCSQGVTFENNNAISFFFLFSAMQVTELIPILVRFLSMSEGTLVRCKKMLEVFVLEDVAAAAVFCGVY